MADNNKVKFSITSDGTSEGTKVILNGENIIDSKSVVSCDFSARAAAAYPTFDGSMRQNPESISFSYLSIDKNDKGEKIYTRYEFNLSEDKWEPKITPLGQPVPEDDGGMVEDSINMIGRDSKIVHEILGYKDKTKRYIPSRNELVKRSINSLKDMLEDLKKEI